MIVTPVGLDREVTVTDGINRPYYGDNLDVLREHHLPEITAPTLLVGGGPTSHIPQDLLVDVSRAVPAT